MPEPNLRSQNSNYDWQLLTEVLIPSEQGLETHVVGHIASILQQFDLELGQQNQILSAVNQALQNLDGSFAPLHLRISVSGLNLAGRLPENGPDEDRDSEQRGSGLSFFLVKRIVGHLPDQESEKYRLLEVLIYGE